MIKIVIKMPTMIYNTESTFAKIFFGAITLAAVRRAIANPQNTNTGVSDIAKNGSIPTAKQTSSHVAFFACPLFFSPFFLRFYFIFG